MGNDIRNGHTLKVIHLTTRKNGWQNLMLLRCGKDKDHMCWWLFQCLQESIESRLRKHVNLVNDEYLIFSYLWRYSCLIHQALDMLNTIVAGSIKFEDIKRPLLCKCLTALTLTTGIAIGSRIGTVDYLGKDTRTSGLAHTTRPAKEICVCKFSACHGILQSCGECLLSYDCIK